MDNHHKRIKKQAVEKIKALLKLRVSANESKCLEQLDSQIEEEYNWYKEILRVNNESIPSKIIPKAFSFKMLAVGALIYCLKVFTKK